MFTKYYSNDKQHQFQPRSKVCPETRNVAVQGGQNVAMGGKVGKLNQVRGQKQKCRKSIQVSNSPSMGLAALVGVETIFRGII